MFSVSQKNKILNSKKIYLLGRGPTAKYLNYRTDKNVYISINLKKKNFINIDKEKILSSKNKIKVGSVFFGLYAILTEINNLLHKYKVYKKFIYTVLILLNILKMRTLQKKYSLNLICSKL